MNSLQLAVFLEHIEKRLVDAIETADCLMPDDIERLPERHYKGNSPFPRLDSASWELKNTGKPVAFCELIELKVHLKKQIESLKADTLGHTHAPTIST